MPSNDPLTAVVLALKADNAIREWCTHGDQVYIFGQEIPNRRKHSEQPNTILVEQRGGDRPHDWNLKTEWNYTITIYAKSVGEARKGGYNRIFERMRTLRHEEHDGLFIYNASCSGPYPYRDPATEWPAVTCEALIKISWEPI